MSGGSYNYLCYKNGADLGDHKQELEKMHDRLVELGHLDAATATQNVINYIDELNKLVEDMYHVWHAVEWADSGDWSLHDVGPVIEKWRCEQDARRCTDDTTQAN